MAAAGGRRPAGGGRRRQEPGRGETAFSRESWGHLDMRGSLREACGDEVASSAARREGRTCSNTATEECAGPRSSRNAVCRLSTSHPSTLSSSSCRNTRPEVCADPPGTTPDTHSRPPWGSSAPSPCSPRGVNREHPSTSQARRRQSSRTGRRQPHGLPSRIPRHTATPPHRHTAAP